jgi:hypothetical protein
MMSKKGLPMYDRRSAGDAYEYAINVLHHRFPDGEPLIAQHPSYAFVYARDIIKGRWPMGEPAMKSNPHWWKLYQDMLKIPTYREFAK